MSAPSLDQIATAVIDAFPKLSAPEQRVALALYRLLMNGDPVVPGKISAATGESPETVGAMLAKWHGIERRTDGAVTAFWGLTLSKTKHRFRVDGRVLYTWCAWDTLFLPPLLGAAAEVESACPASGKPIALRIGPRGVEAVQPETVVLSFVLPREAEVERNVIESFCCHVHFFASVEAARGWRAVHPHTFVLSIADACQIGARKNSAQYHAPLCLDRRPP